MNVSAREDPTRIIMIGVYGGSWQLALDGLLSGIPL